MKGLTDKPINEGRNRGMKEYTDKGLKE